MRNFLWKVKVVTRKCSASLKSFLFLFVGKNNTDEKVLNMCAKLKLISLWPLCGILMRQNACWHGSSVKMLTVRWFVSSPLCFEPGPPTLTLVFVQGGGLYMSPNQSQLLGEAAWFWVFHVWKDVCDQNEISFHIWSGQLSNYYGICRRCWHDHSV